MLTLGIDVGTTKTAAVVLSNNGDIKFLQSMEHHADIETAPYKSEQDVAVHISIVKRLIQAIDPETRRSIRRIGISGQMHGVVCWNTTETSTLVTWQDKRASTEHKLTSLCDLCGETLRDGWGFTTLAIEAAQFAHYTKCGTIHDYVAWWLVGSPDITVMDTTNAASWGLFDVFRSEWKNTAIEKLNVPAAVLPKISPCGSKYGTIGSSVAAELGLCDDVSVTVPIGDNQASVLGTATNYDEELFVTFGTGSQLSTVLSVETAQSLSDSPKFELRPFVDGRILAVAAPVCGGKSWAWLKDTVKGWMASLGLDCTIDDNELYKKIDELGVKELDKPDLPVFEPHFLGERWDPDLTATIGNIGLTNFSLGKIAASLALGLAKNLQDNFPMKCFDGKTVLVASGNAIRRSKCLQQAMTKTFGLPLRLSDSVEEAACGAARLALRNAM